MIALILFRFGKSNRFKPDLYIEDGYALPEYGFDARVLTIPGHSIGILTVIGDLLCGDLFDNTDKPVLNSIMDDLAAVNASVENSRWFAAVSLIFRKERNRPMLRLLLFGPAIAIILTACQAPTPTSTVVASPAVTSTTQAFLTVTPVPTSSPLPIAQPDGKLLVVSGQEGNSEIYLTNFDGTGSVNLTNHSMDDLNPVWSPDGQFIAFSSIRDGQEQIYLMRPDGTQVTPIPNTGPLDSPVGWSPDGQYFLLVSYRDVNADIFALKPDGTSLVNLSHHPANDWHAAWSPDGSRIAFNSDRNTEAGEHVTQICAMDVHDTNVVRLTDFPKGACCPVWSPDGRHIAFSVTNDVGSRMDVYLMEADGANARQLTNQPGQNVPQTWSPDGKEMVVTQFVYGTAQTLIVAMEDGVSERLPINSPYMRWQPRGDLAPAITLPTPPPEPTPPPSLALVNGTLIDGTGAEPIHDAILVIQNGRIVTVGLRAEIPILPEAQVIDIQGGTILPGFINTHVHQTTIAQNLAAWAQAGVTTVRSLAEEVGGLYHDWNRWVEQADDNHTRPFLFAYRDVVLNHPQYARLVAAGPIVSVPDGYPISYWGPGIDLAVTSPDDARQKVTALLNAGADVVKISLETGPRLSEVEVRAIVAVAHQRGTLVAAHVVSSRYLSEGVTAGIDDAAHIATDRWSNELLDQMVTNDVYLVPTLAVLSRACGQPGDCLDNLRRFVEAGGKVALGDDYGNPGIKLGMPIREMELMQQSGMTPMQIIIAATKQALMCAIWRRTWAPSNRAKSPMCWS